MTFHAAKGADLAQARQCTLLLPAVSTGNVPQVSKQSASRTKSRPERLSHLTITWFSRCLCPLSLSQLCIDLLLSSLPHELLGTLHSPHVQACVGWGALDADSSGSPSALVTSVQLFLVPSLRLVVVQQRAPCIVGRHAAFVEELLTLAREWQVTRVICATSSAAFRQGEEELDAMHPVSFFLCDPAQKGGSNELDSSLRTLVGETLQWRSLHAHALRQDEAPFRPDQLNSAEELEHDADDEQKEEALPVVQPIPVPGLGLTRPLYERVSAEANSNSSSSASAAASSSSAAATVTSTASLPFPTLFLHVYVNEGANDADAMRFAQQLYTLLFLLRQQEAGTAAASSAAELSEPQEMKWRVPASWSHMFGSEPDESLYL